MATQQSELVADYGVSFIGGQDASKAPDKIPQDSFQAGVNITTKNGVIGPRNALDQLQLNIVDQDFILSTKQTRPVSDIFYSGKYQAWIPYSIGREFYQIVVISGIIYLVNQNTLAVSVITIEDGSRLNESAMRLNWSQAGKFVVIFDYPARPVIIEGSTARRSDPKKNEVPISRLGTYNQNRLFIANFYNEFTAGDATGNIATPNAPITFNEVLQPASPFRGDLYQLPTGEVNTPITAMTFLQFTDTSTGIGPLIVGTQRSNYSFTTQVPRNNWLTGQFGTNFTYETGIAGARAFANVNSDLFFISRDGQLRSASMSRDEQHKWARVPLSREVQNWLKMYDPSLVPYSTVAYFNNRIFMTANPYLSPARNTSGGMAIDVAFAGMVVITLDNISNLNSLDSKPVWDGLWTGVRPMDFCFNDNRFFIISKDAAFRNQIYEMDPTSAVDRAGTKRRRPVGILYTREYDWQSPFQNKEPHSIDVALNNIEGDFNMNIEFKPFQSPKYLPWKKFSYVAPAQTCQIPTPIEINGFAPHNFKDLIFGQPDGSDECNPVTLEKYQMFRKMQLKFTLQGDNWALNQFRINALTRPQTQQVGVCTTFPVVPLMQECSHDWDYEDFGP